MKTLPVNSIKEKANALKNAYQRIWYKNHPGKNYEYQRRYWIKKAIELVNKKTEPQ